MREISASSQLLPFFAKFLEVLTTSGNCRSNGREKSRAFRPEPKRLDTSAICEPCVHRRSTARARPAPWRAVPRIGAGQGPWGRCASRGGASQGRTATGTNMGPPCRSGVAETPPRTGTQWKQPRGQLLPPVRGNARRRVWRRGTKSRRRIGCRVARAPTPVVGPAHSWVR